jgi:thioredoxin-dependent peroxiredoxin
MPLIDPGQTVPDFTLPDQHGTPRSLSDYRGKAVALYFYPEDDTPLCTEESCQFRDFSGQFAKFNAVVIGVSPQDSASKQAFAAKFSLPFPLLADVPGSDGTPRVSAILGAWREKNMYGRRFIGMARTTYLIDAEGRVARRWDSVKTPGHGQAVLEAVKTLHSGGEAATTSGAKTVASTARGKAGRPAKKSSVKTRANKAQTARPLAVGKTMLKKSVSKKVGVKNTSAASSVGKTRGKKVAAKPGAKSTRR